MPSQALNWYLNNDVTVQTATNTDIRALTSTAATSNEAQTVAFTNANQGQGRVFDPANTGVTTSADVQTTTLNHGWAIQASDLVPADARCKAFIPAQNIVIPSVVRLTWTGSPSGAITLLAKAAFWRYNTVTGATSLITWAQATLPSWNTLLGSPASGTQQNVNITVAFPNTTLERNEILLLKSGLFLETTPAPLLGGTVNYTAALGIGTAATTRMNMQGAPMRQICSVVDAGSTVGQSTKGNLVIAKSAQKAYPVATGYRNLLVVFSERDVSGSGVGTKTLKVTHSDDREALATSLKRARVRKVVTGQAVGQGVRSARTRKSAVVGGEVEPNFERLWEAVRMASVEGAGTEEFDRTVIFVRNVSVAGVGFTDPNQARISLPLADLPDSAGGGTVNIRKIFPIFEG